MTSIIKKLSLALIVFLLISCSSEDTTFIDEEDVIIDDDKEEDHVSNLIFDNVSEGSLNSFLSNALISDLYNNIERQEPIKIIEFDSGNNRIKTSYAALESLLVKGSNNETWFITQNREASTVVEITSVDVSSGWINLGETYLGNFNSNIGTTLEFFNPFVNYKIINDSPLFNPYPTQVVEGNFNYIQSGGLIEKADGTYVLLTPVVFGSHEKRSIYYATSSNLEDWSFNNVKLLGTENIPFAKSSGNVFSVDNPFKLDDGRLLVLLGVEQPNGKYTSAYMIIDEDLNVLQQPKEIKISEWHGEEQNSFPLALTKFNNQYRILFHRRNTNFIDREIHELIVSDLFEALDENKGVISSKLIHRGNESSGYLAGKADDASYITFNSELYIIVGGEEVSSNYLTSRNREYGLMRWSEGIWKHDSRSPLIINPVQLYKKYPIYNWAWDHLGGFISPIIKDDTLYIYMAFGTDNPDYYLTGIKIALY